MKVSPPTSRQPTLLLVEDDELVRDAMTRLFVREGYLVLTAATGHDAIGLPDVSGADLCARLRQFFPYMPVVVCTGAASPEEAAGLRELGITHFFCKPISMPELIAAVRSALNERPLPPSARLT